jgi:hypothetical protein
MKVPVLRMNEVAVCFYHQTPDTQNWPSQSYLGINKVYNINSDVNLGSWKPQGNVMDEGKAKDRSPNLFQESVMA